MSSATHPNFEDEVFQRFDQVMEKLSNHNGRLIAVEELVQQQQPQIDHNTEDIVELQTGLASLTKRLDDLPKQFADLIDDRNVLYLKNFGKRTIRWVGGLLLVGSGAVVSELVKTWF